MKQRLFYLDAIRAIAMLSVVFFHYQVNLSSWYPELERCVLNAYAYNGCNLGAWGVSLFFMLSGASLMISQKADPPALYYKKRFLALYPSFWIAWLAAWGISIVVLGVWERFSAIPAWTLILSLTGLDGYLLCYGSNFYIVGEWFLGCIILIYLFVPLLRRCLEKKAFLTMGVLTAAWIAANVFYRGTMGVTQQFFVRIYEVAVGMCLMRYCKKCNVFMGLSGLALAAVSIFLPFSWEGTGAIRYALIGIGTFVFLRWLLEGVSPQVGGRAIQTVKRCVAWLSSISYEVFLVHHFLLVTVLGYLTGWSVTLDKTRAWLLLALFFCATFVCAFVLQKCRVVLLRILRGRKTNKVQAS